MKSETKIGLRKDAYKALILTVAVMVIRGISSIDGSVNIVAVLVAVPMVFAFMLGVLTLYRRLTKSKS